MVDGLLFFAADGVDEFNQFAIEDVGNGLYQLLLRLLPQGVAGVAADGQAGEFERTGFDVVGVDGAEQFADELAEFDAAGKAYAVTDNDGVDDSSGETLFFPVELKGTN